MNVKKYIGELTNKIVALNLDKEVENDMTNDLADILCECQDLINTANLKQKEAEELRVNLKIAQYNNENLIDILQKCIELYRS